MVWKDVVGYEGLYMVSDTGVVMSLYHNKILSSPAGSHGYPNVVLCKNRIKKTHTVHRLVAEAFLENPEGYPCINHKDENKANNHASNLEWCTYTYNGMYGVRGMILDKKRRPVAQFSADGTLLSTYESRCDAAKAMHGNAGSITRAINGERKTYKGYVWKELES